MKKDRRNRLEAFLGILLGLGGMLLLGYFLWVYRANPTAATASSAPPTQEPLKLWDAYEEARTAVREEAEDAKLVSASTQWQTVDEGSLLAGADDWTFTFYSPANEKVLDVVLNNDAISAVDQTKVWNTPATMDEGAWKRGPRDALLVFLAQGGRDYLGDHPQAIVDLHLGSSDSGKAAWNVIALDVSDRSSLALLIDAETMEILSITP